MKKLFLLLSALILTFGQASPVQAGHHSPQHFPKVNGSPMTVYIENRVAFDSVNTAALNSDWRWGENSYIGPVRNYVDLWALPWQQRTRGGDDCTPVEHRIVLCINESIANPTAFASADAANHRGFCVIHMRLSWWQNGGGWNTQQVLDHEIGHCLGLNHGGTGIMNGGPSIDAHDRDAVAFIHNHNP